jgi:GxxExxY protein
MRINDLTAAIIGAAMRVHSVLGPGLLESTYEGCLVHELNKQGVRTAAQVSVPVVYDGIKLEAGYRIDLLVEDTVIIELKAVDELAPIHKAQLRSYLKLSGKYVGLLINFNVVHLRDGIKRGCEWFSSSYPCVHCALCGEVLAFFGYPHESAGFLPIHAQFAAGGALLDE